MISAVALDVNRREIKSVETPFQSAANGEHALEAAERGASMRSDQSLNAAMEGKQTRIFLQKLAPPTESEQANMPAVTSGGQDSVIAKGAEIKKFLLSANGDTENMRPVQAAPKDVMVPESVKTASPPPEFASVEQWMERPPFFINEQLISKASSPEKTREVKQNSSHQLISADSIAQNDLGSTPTAAFQPQPERAAASAGNLETWREVMNQVREGIMTNVDQNNREVHIQLDPPELGKLAIQLVVEGEHIRAHIVAESADVGALIQSHLPELKQALQSHRLDLDAVHVEVQAGGGNPNTSSHNSQQQERASRHGGNLSVARADSRDSETDLTTPPVDHRGRVNVWA
jgi:flagellar hook-length control protein FliK